MASGNTLGNWTAGANEPPVASFATPDLRNGRLCLDFDGAADEEAIFSGIIPSHYSGGGLTVKLHIRFTTAVAGTANVEVSVENEAALDGDSDSFDTMTDGSVTPNGTSGVETVVTIALANSDSLAAGNAFRLRVHRDADGTNGTDDITTDMELYEVELLET